MFSFAIRVSGSKSVILAQRGQGETRNNEKFHLARPACK